MSPTSAAAVTETATLVFYCTAIIGAAQPAPTKLVLLGAVPWSLETKGCATTKPKYHYAFSLHCSQYISYGSSQEDLFLP